jgi:hypothetical protein
MICRDGVAPALSEAEVSPCHKSRASTERDGYGGFILLLSVSLIAVIAMGQTATFDFVNYDDNSEVLQKREYRWRFNLASDWVGLHHIHSQNWHPVTSVSHMVDCQFFGLTPRGPHLVNVARQSEQSHCSNDSNREISSRTSA